MLFQHNFLDITYEFTYTSHGQFFLFALPQTTMKINGSRWAKKKNRVRSGVRIQWLSSQMFCCVSRTQNHLPVPYVPMHVPVRAIGERKPMSHGGGEGKAGHRLQQGRATILYLAYQQQQRHHHHHHHHHLVAQQL